MFFSKLGPATAAHSACREDRASVSPKTQTESPRDSPQDTKKVSSPKSRHFNSETAFSLPINSNRSLLPGEAGYDLDTEGGASGRDPAGTSGR